MSNIYDSANQIEREIRELPEFKALKEAYEKVQANEEAHKLFKDSNRITRKTNEWTRVQRRRCNESTRNGCENPIRRSNQ